jgi:cytochrome P450
MSVALPPGPAAPPALQTARWLLRPISFMESCRRRFGDAFSVRFLGFSSPMVMLSDPEAIRALYTNPAHDLPPGRGIALLPVVGPRSVLLLEGSEHMARRKLMLPPFHGKRMRAYEAIVAAVAERDLDGWPLGEPFPVHPRMQAVTLDVIVRAVFGVTDPARGGELRELLRRLLDGTASFGLQFGFMLARRFGGPDPLAKLRVLRSEIDGLLLAEIAERRSAGAGGEDILSALMAARFEDGEPMSDAELCDQLVTLLVAGHETTATALAWTLELLVHHPEALRALQEDLDGGSDVYLRAVIAEALRLRPVLPLAGRRLTSPLPVNGSELPPGTDVTPSIWLAHTRADLYTEPFAFRPERFLDAPAPGYAWVPFGGGVRRCLGAAFAEMEMRVVLATVLRRMDVAAADARPERVARRNVTFSPRNGTRLRATRRRP